jgi:iron(III) transport system substrate-binding protein
MRAPGWGRSMVGGLVLAASLAIPSAGARTTEEIAHLATPDRQAILEQGARQEGTLTIYSSLIVDQVLRPLADAFGKKYPYLKIEYWRGEARPIIQKVLAELRTGTTIGDVIETTSIEPPLVQAGALATFRTPEIEALPADYRDPTLYSAPTRCNYYGAAYNTKLIPTGTQPTRYEDLLDPKWQGKIAWNVDTDSGAPLFISNLLLAWGETKAIAFVKSFARQLPIPFDGSARALVNRVMEGEYPLSVNIQLQHPLISLHAGAPVAPLPMDPVAVMCSTVMLVKGTKHPSAAMLFVDFMVGKDGQTVLRDHEYLTVNPLVPPLEQLQEIVPHMHGYKETFIRAETMYKMNERSEALLNEYFQ